jgi:predicted ATPase
MRLIVEALGWDQGTGRSVELTMPADVLRRAFERLREAARQVAEEEAQQRAEQARTRLLTETCEGVLAALDEQCWR